jgi:hypothetical protein
VDANELHELTKDLPEWARPEAVQIDTDTGMWGSTQGSFLETREAADLFLAAMVRGLKQIGALILPVDSDNKCPMLTVLNEQAMYAVHGQGDTLLHQLADLCRNAEAARGGEGGTWREKCKITQDAQPDGDNDWWAVHSPDRQHYLDENDGKWKECPQVMAGWFMSQQSAKQALDRAESPPGVAP